MTGRVCFSPFTLSTLSCAGLLCPGVSSSFNHSWHRCPSNHLLPEPSFCPSHFSESSPHPSPAAVLHSRMCLNRCPLPLLTAPLPEAATQVDGTWTVVFQVGATAILCHSDLGDEELVMSAGPPPGHESTSKHLNGQIWLYLTYKININLLVLLVPSSAAPSPLSVHFSRFHFCHLLSVGVVHAAGQHFIPCSALQMRPLQEAWELMKSLFFALLS